MDEITNKSIYTMKQWKKDGSFAAKPGQEISSEVYDQMLNGLPPKDLPRSKAIQALENYNIPVHAGFLMGEPHSLTRSGSPLYLAFASNDFGKGAKYYYIGLSIEAPKFSGEYYFFDCLNAELNKFFKASAFKNDKEAIEIAANYEAILYKCIFDYKGEQIDKAVLYDPYGCFDN